MYSSSSSSKKNSSSTSLCLGFGILEEGLWGLIVHLLRVSFHHRLFFVPFRFSTFKGRSSPRSMLVLALNIFELVPLKKQGGGELQQ